MSIEQLLSNTIGEGFEGTATILRNQEIDVKTFYELDEDILKEASKCHIYYIMMGTLLLQGLSRFVQVTIDH